MESKVVKERIIFRNITGCHVVADELGLFIEDDMPGWVNETLMNTFKDVVALDFELDVCKEVDCKDIVEVQEAYGDEYIINKAKEFILNGWLDNKIEELKQNIYNSFSALKPSSKNDGKDENGEDN